MKTFLGIYFCLLLCMFSSCDIGVEDSSNDSPPVFYHTVTIPLNDRFIYDVDDTLIYSCNDNSLDTVWVKSSVFKTIEYSQTGTIFGDVHKYKVDWQEVIIESSASVEWNTILDTLKYIYGDIIYPCYIIQTGTYSESSHPICLLYNGCEYTPYATQIGYSEGVTSSVSLNGYKYNNVYGIAREIEAIGSYKVYMNLKYGIIRFESVINGTSKIWDLQNPR